MSISRQKHKKKLENNTARADMKPNQGGAYRNVGYQRDRLQGKVTPRLSLKKRKAVECSKREGVRYSEVQG